MTPKTIMIDGYNLGLEKGTGVATYARNLSYECKALGYRVEVVYGNRASQGKNPLMREVTFFDPVGDTPPKWQLYLEHARRIVTSPHGIRANEIPVTGKIITKTFQSRLPAFDALWNAPNLFGRALTQFDLFGRFNTIYGVRRPDIMHWTYPLPLKMPRAKNIYTMHDLVPLRLPYTTLDSKRRYLKLMRRIVKTADHIVTVSETSRRDIIELLGCPEDKVTNTYQAVDIPAKYAEKPEEVVKREVEGTLGLDYKGYYLFFGSIEPKKNIGRLIEAYLASRVEAPLVVIGAQAWKSEQELRLLNDQTNRYLEQIDNFVFTRDRVRRFEYAPFPLLVSAIRGAKAVCFPSLYEGFGLPVLEAMLLGTPVITSTEGSTPEVAGDAALMVDPYDTRALAEAIRRIDSDEELRASLSEKGRRQAALFSSERYRERLKALYESL